MKKKNIFWSLFALLAIPASSLFTSCENADVKPIDNRVYIHEAASAPAAKYAVEIDGIKIALTVRMAQIVDQDVTVKLELDPSVLATYNAVNKTNYEILPAEYFTFESNECVIKAGQVSAPQIKINVKSFTTKGKNYALPVAITHVSGPAEKTATSSKFVIQLDKPLIVKTPILTGSGWQGSEKSIVTGPLDASNVPVKWGVNTNDWTLEGWVRMDGFRMNNQALFTSGSSEHEIYIRFGDANPTNPSPDPKEDRFNYLQIKTLGSQVNTGFIFTRDKWAHFCLTYNGTTCTIYINGKSEAEFAPPAPKGGIVRIDGMTMIGSGSTYFKNKCNLSQVRLWKVALSQIQIQNNMFYELDATNPDMIAYWKMDEGEGENFKDATSNGHDAIVGTGILKGWTDYLRFDK